jgi:hypothetical protein
MPDMATTLADALKESLTAMGEIRTRAEFAGRIEPHHPGKLKAGIPGGASPAKFQVSFILSRFLMRMALILVGSVVLAGASESLPDKDTVRLVALGELQWDLMRPFSEGLAGVAKDGQWGFIDLSGKLVIPLQREWKYQFPFKNGLAQVDMGQENSDFIDRAGRLLIKSGQSNIPAADIAWARKLPTSPIWKLEFRDGLLPVMNKHGRWGFVNPEGSLAIPPQWIQVSDFNEGLAMVSNRSAITRVEHAGYIDTHGKIVIPLTWNRGWLFSEGLAAVAVNGRWGFIDKSGAVVIALQWDSCEIFDKGYALVSKGRKFGVIDRTGKVIIEPTFDGFDRERSPKSNLPIVVILDRKKAIIDKSGHLAGGLWWDSVEPLPSFASKDSPSAFRSDLLRVDGGGKCVLVDSNGGIVVEPQWESIFGGFEGDMLAVCQNRKWGFVGRDGKFVITPQWDRLGFPPFTEGVLVAQKDRKWGVFDQAGHTIVEPRWDIMNGFSGGLAAVRLNGKWGLISKNGRLMCPEQWDWAGEPPHDGVMQVEIGKKWGLLKVERN